MSKYFAIQFFTYIHSTKYCRAHRFTKKLSQHTTVLIQLLHNLRPVASKTYGRSMREKSERASDSRIVRSLRTSWCVSDVAFKVKYSSRWEKWKIQWLERARDTTAVLRNIQRTPSASRREEALSRRRRRLVEGSKRFRIATREVSFAGGFADNKRVLGEGKHRAAPSTGTIVLYMGVTCWHSAIRYLAPIVSRLTTAFYEVDRYKVPSHPPRNRQQQQVISSRSSRQRGGGAGDAYFLTVVVVAARAYFSRKQDPARSMRPRNLRTSATYRKSPVPIDVAVAVTIKKPAASQNGNSGHSREDDRKSK